MASSRELVALIGLQCASANDLARVPRSEWVPIFAMARRSRSPIIRTAAAQVLVWMPNAVRTRAVSAFIEASNDPVAVGFLCVTGPSIMQPRLFSRLDATQPGKAMLAYLFSRFPRIKHDYNSALGLATRDALASTPRRAPNRRSRDRVAAEEVATRSRPDERP